MYLDGGLVVDVNWPESWAGGSKGDRAAFYLGNIQSWGERRDTLRAPTLSCRGATSDATPLAGTAASSGSAAWGLGITREQAGEGQKGREHWGPRNSIRGKESAIQPCPNPPCPESRWHKPPGRYLWKEVRGYVCPSPFPSPSLLYRRITNLSLFGETEKQKTK